MAPDPLPNEQTLLQNALAHVRAVCKGNGVKESAVTILSHTISTQSINAGTYLELKPVIKEKSAPGKTVVGTLATSRDDAMQKVNQAMMQAARDPVAKAQIADTLLRRADQGFGLNRQSVPLDFLKRDYTWHEACPTCRGSAQSTCGTCHGRKLETCTKCTGRGLMACPVCRATGLVQGNKCSRCFGQRYVACDLCNRSGFMTCRTCRATGLMRCQACNGQGWKSTILNLSAVALTYFEYDAKSLPKAAADMIETQAASLAALKKVGVQGRIADDKENVLGASYEVKFPCGDIVFGIGKKQVKASLFGYGADITGFPNILDKMLAAPVEELEAAVNDVGSVAQTIKKVTRYRLIAQSFLLASRMNLQRASAALLKKYDIGLSPGMAERIISLADQSTRQITKKPRLHGLLTGLGGVLALSAFYYLFGLRVMLASLLPDIRLDFILDILFVALGGFATIGSIQLFARKSIREALGHLLAEGQKKALIPKLHNSGWYGFAGTALMCLAMMELSIHMSRVPPHWYHALRSLFN